MDYSQYTATDFVMTASFRLWVNRTDDEACAFWYNWVLQHPHRLPEVEEARKMLKVMQLKESVSYVAEMEAVRGNIDALLEQRGGKKHTVRIKMFRFAAVAALLLLLGSLAVLYMTQQVKQTTDFAATREVVLPDGTKVRLNANSSVTCKKYWNSWKEREVWLEGEAFFKVTSKPQGYHPKFVVHTKGLDIAVVGTAFNVYSRRNTVDVVLQEGRVVAHGTGEAAQAGIYNMHAGQLLQLNKGRIQLSETDAAASTAWMLNRLEFVNTPLQKVARVLEDNYGYTVIWKQNAMKDTAFTGSCSSDNIKVLIAAIGAVYNSKVTIKGNIITFE